MESIDDILFKRTSNFIFNLYYHLEPTVLAGKLMSRGYFNERQSSQVMFFDLSLSKFGKRSLLNRVREFTLQWAFGWVGITPEMFKTQLKTQFQSTKNWCHQNLVSVLAIFLHFTPALWHRRVFPLVERVRSNVS